ncbi:MAG: nitroreductase family protein [Oscillospiraceae bacterium]|nr:nitroreductase family protein [Oscillospiraceae bacterium]
MDFLELIRVRQSCRSYDDRPVEEEKLRTILEAGRLSPSACNGQPYHITVCRGEAAKKAAAACGGMGMNKFARQAPVILVLSEEDYVASAAMGAKLKHNDYRSMDIGILAAQLTLAAAELGLGTCILGWFDDGKLRALCGLTRPVRLAITLGYPGDALREKKRKPLEELVSEVSSC